MVCHLSLGQSFGAFDHDGRLAHSNQVHRLMPKDQPLLALLAQVLGDLLQLVLPAWMQCP
jgi:hypothetical protein